MKIIHKQLLWAFFLAMCWKNVQPSNSGGSFSEMSTDSFGESDDSLWDNVEDAKVKIMLDLEKNNVTLAYFNKILSQDEWSTENTAFKEIVSESCIFIPAKFYEGEQYDVYGRVINEQFRRTVVSLQFSGFELYKRALERYKNDITCIKVDFKDPMTKTRMDVAKAENIKYLISECKKLVDLTLLSIADETVWYGLPTVFERVEKLTLGGVVKLAKTFITVDRNNRQTEITINGFDFNEMFPRLEEVTFRNLKELEDKTCLRGCNHLRKLAVELGPGKFLEDEFVGLITGKFRQNARAAGNQGLEYLHVNDIQKLGTLKEIAKLEHLKDLRFGKIEPSSFTELKNLKFPHIETLVIDIKDVVEQPFDPLYKFLAISSHLENVHILHFKLRGGLLETIKNMKMFPNIVLGLTDQYDENRVVDFLKNYKPDPQSKFRKLEIGYQQFRTSFALNDQFANSMQQKLQKENLLSKWDFRHLKLGTLAFTFILRHAEPENVNRLIRKAVSESSQPAKKPKK